MTINFRNALVISTALHCSILGPLSSPQLLDRHRDEKPLVVDYVVLKEPKTSSPKGEEARPVVGKPTLELLKEKEPRNETEKRLGDKKTPEKPDEASHEAVKRAQIRSTRDYINYYYLIREKIRRRLKSNYKNYHAEGDVHVVFTLNSRGGLVSIDVDPARSTPDTILHDIALSSVREASPLPPFPNALNLPKMSFNLAISFKRE